MVVSGGRDQRRRGAEDLFRSPSTLRYIRQGLVQAEGAGSCPLLCLSYYRAGTLTVSWYSPPDLQSIFCVVLMK